MIPISGAVSAAWATYKAGILVGVAIALLAAGFYAGKRWEVGNTEKAKAKVVAAEQDRDAWHRRADSFQGATQRWEERYAADQRALSVQKAQAGKLLEKLAEQQTQAAQREADWRKRYAAAIKTPDCAELLKETKCAAFRSY